MNIEYPKTIISAIAAIVIGTIGVNTYIVKTAKEAIAGDLQQLQAADAQEAKDREVGDLETQLDLTILELDELLEVEDPDPKTEKRIRYLEKREIILEQRLMELTTGEV